MDIFNPNPGTTHKAQKLHTHSPMNSSKLALTITAVVGFHLVVGTIILLQPGCKSDAPASPPPPAAANTTAAATPPPADFVEPTRPVTPETPVAEGNMTTSEPLTPMPGLNAPGTPTPAGPTVTYEVKKGDNLSKIAHAEKVSLADLEAANNLTSKSVLKLGQTLTIPTGSSPAPAATPSTGATPAEAPSAAGGAIYTVKPGDSLSAIAHKNGTSVSALKEANHLTSNNIRAGQVLTLPAAGSASTAAAAPTTSTASAAPEAGVYVVQSGDSPAKIAKKEGVKVADLMKLNNISDPRSLRVGQKLQLPSGATAASTSALSSPTTPAESMTPAPGPSNTTISPTPDTTIAPAPANSTAASPAGNSTVEENVPVTPVTPSN